MKRWIAVSIALIFVAGCSGMGSGNNRFLPGASGANDFATRGASFGLTPQHRRGSVHVAFRMRIPRHRRGERTMMHPSTISPSTQSVSIAVNGGTASVFNATPSSPNCSAGASGTTCTFNVGAPPGADTFTVRTYSGTGGGGTILDQGIAVVNIVAGKSNSAAITVGPVVTSTSDSGPGSLRYAIGAASTGDTVMFVLPAGSTVTLASPIKLNANVNIAGPGVTTSIRMHRNRRGLRSHTTYSGTTLSGGGANQIFIIPSGVTTTISGLILTDGLAGPAAEALKQPGGAINNAGNLTLTNDAFTDNLSNAEPYLRRAPHHKLARYRGGGRAPKSKNPDFLHPHVCPPNVLDQYAGAVYNNGVLVMSGTTFDSNSVSNTQGVCKGYGYGGAIYNDQYGTLLSSGDTYVNNAAYEGGAVYNYSGYGQATFTNDLFSGNLGCTSANGCTPSGCGASSCTVYWEGYGAAIYDDWGPGVVIANSTFTNNVAGGDSPDSYGEGGALYLDTNNPSITGSTFSGNVAGGGHIDESSGYGGAFVMYAQSLALNNDTFTNNVAGGDYYAEGGAFYASTSCCGSISGSNDTFTGNVAEGFGSTSYLYDEAYGGAISDDDYYNLTLSNSTFTNNVATAAYESYGGACYCYYAPTTLNNDTFTGNSAVATGSTDYYTYAYAGAVYFEGYQGNVSNSTFTSNSAMAQGTYGYEAYAGAVYNDSGYGSANNVYDSNWASATGPYNYSYVYGGAIYSDSNFSSLNDTYKNNWVTGFGGYTTFNDYGVWGGAVYNDSNGTIVHGTFTGNYAQAPNAFGGALDNESTLTISNSTFTGNSAGTGTQQGVGGAIFDDSSITFSGGTISGNTATTAGGGFFSYSSDTIANATISGNSVTAAANYWGGGGLYNDGPTTLMNSTVSGNTVATTGQYAGGGGIYDDDALVMTGSTVSGNSVTGSQAYSGGGGVFSVYDSSITNSTITGNSSSTNGGGFDDEATSSSSRLTNVTLFKNTASGNGGNLYDDHYTYIYNSIFGGGTAASGGDIYNAGPGTLYSYDYNIMQTAIAGSGTVSGTTTHNQVADPKLLTLTNNGGPTFTNAEQASSPGVGAIPWTSASNGTCGNATGIGVDQRNFTRGASSTCDVGAFELNGTPSAIKVRPHAVRRAGGHKHHTFHFRHPAKPKKPVN